MAGECTPEGRELKDMEEEELWELINDNRHKISLDVRPSRVIPYLRQARVLTEMDEDEILSCQKLSNRSMRTSYMLDLLRTQGRNGAVALLDSLMIHYPTLYTQVTGRKASIEPSRFSGLIKYSELTEYLVRAVTGMQKELQEARSEASRMTARCTSLEAEISQILEHEEKTRYLQIENERMQRQIRTLQREITKMKDEKCDFYVRYTAAIEEKSALNMRLHELTLQMYQLQTELQKAQTENEYQKRCSLKCMSSLNTPQLQEEVRSLRCQLDKAVKLDPARNDILAQDLAEAIGSQVELAEQLQSYREENEQLHRDKQTLLEQKECLNVQVQQLSLDCSMHEQKATVIQEQTRELQEERHQAYQSRDEAQAMITRILTEKDCLRSNLVELQERLFSLKAVHGSRERRQSSDDLDSSWKSPVTCCEESPISARRKLRRMDAVNPMSMSSPISEGEDLVMCSVRSRQAEPPCPESLRRREKTLYRHCSEEAAETDSLSDDFVFLPLTAEEMCRNATQDGTSRDSLSQTSVPPFLMRSRPKAIRINGRVLTISFQGETLLKQLSVVGGNKTGVFVHELSEGSAAQMVGISPGAQIVEVQYEQREKALRMVLEDSTLEEAVWALGQVTGFCHLSLRPRPDDYQALVQQLQSGAVSSGDSFYVRVNMSLSSSCCGTLAVSCNDIIHVTNTWPSGAPDSWQASQVHPCQLLHLQSGTVPNYLRAQGLLIRALEDMNFQTKSQKSSRAAPQKQSVRIVSTGRQGRNPLWVSFEKDGSPESGDITSKGCVTLMPYTLVTPHFPPVCRPILLLPSILGRVLDKKLVGWEGFQLLEPETLSPGEHAARLQKSEILEECELPKNTHYTIQSVEKIMKKGIHCVLPLGLDCVRRLHRADIYPIIIFIGQSARSAHKLRSKLQKHGHSEEQLLACSRSEEPLLDKLPCLYHSMALDSWCDSNSLLTRLRTVVWEEQKKIVWVEPDLL
ncbi:caspase recruitment domain-containing protein 14 [Eucyclogobius newberryi]|uniref:caspase recruitment domain-containing protein 14 n=1 Tax=Eucyclogobius newberryi TaxID=166745 RepID=UPI003B5B5949